MNAMPKNILGISDIESGADNNQYEVSRINPSTGTGNPSTIAISVYHWVLIYGWAKRGTIVITRSPPLSSPVSFWWANWLMWGSSPWSYGWESDVLTIRPSWPDCCKNCEYQYCSGIRWDFSI